MLKANGLSVEITRKIQEKRPNIGDMISNGEINLLINIPFGQETRGDSYHLRSAAVANGICYVTTLAGANALAQAISAIHDNRLEPVALQDL
jgi:carbamoyl-phosphate synthase large subunit